MPGHTSEKRSEWGIPAKFNPGCDPASLTALAVATGAAARLTTLDLALPLPAAVHWAAAGVAADAYCLSGMPTMSDYTLLYCAAGGVVGGFGMLWLQRNVFGMNV
jgi:hypothetical protein